MAVVKKNKNKNKDMLQELRDQLEYLIFDVRVAYSKRRNTKLLS